MISTARGRLLAGLPLTQRRVRVAGCETAVLEGGQGPPLVLLHGGIECGGVYWAPVLSRLAERYSLVVPDLPGLGESEPVERLDPPRFASWFRGLIETTCSERPAVIAHSLVGTLAAGFASADGDRLRRLTIYGTPGIGPFRLPFGLRVVAIRFSMNPSERNAERFDRWAFYDLDAAQARNGGWLKAWSDYTRERASVAHVKQTMRRLIRSCTKRLPDEELRRIPVPTGLLWGRHDRFVPLSLAEEASARLGWPLQVIDRTGHVPHIERPREFLEAIA